MRDLNLYWEYGSNTVLDPQHCARQVWLPVPGGPGWLLYSDVQATAAAAPLVPPRLPPRLFVSAPALFIRVVPPKEKCTSRLQKAMSGFFTLILSSRL